MGTSRAEAAPDAVFAPKLGRTEARRLAGATGLPRGRLTLRLLPRADHPDVWSGLAELKHSPSGAGVLVTYLRLEEDFDPHHVLVLYPEDREGWSVCYAVDDRHLPDPSECRTIYEQ